jgi:hypothetical protein
MEKVMNKYRMNKYRYVTYSEVSEVEAMFIMRIANVINLHDLTMTEINNLLNGLDEYYKSENQSIEDFLT